MYNKISNSNKIVSLSIAFTLLLLIVRMILTKSYTYSFYVWNIFLAIVPFLLSKKLSSHSKITFISTIIFTVWLLFFPNAFYILTDFFHYKERKFVPKWYDLLLVFSAAYNGLLLGIISLLQVEIFLQNVFAKKTKNIVIAFILLLSSYGIYIGRFLRYNSWDVVTNTDDVIFTTAHFFVKPWQHLYAWGFIVLFTIFFGIIYYSFKKINNILQYN